MYTNYLKSDFGLMEITADDECVTSVAFVDRMDISKAMNGTNDIAENAADQLAEYFTGERKTFDIKMKQEGTDFQKQVWDFLPSIPYGETTTYGEIAEKLGNSKAVRAVSSAVAKNPFAVIVPCHRVIAKDGSISGYAWGVEKKEALLAFEKKNSIG